MWLLIFIPYVVILDKVWINGLLVLYAFWTCIRQDYSCKNGLILQANEIKLSFKLLCLCALAKYLCLSFALVHAFSSMICWHCQDQCQHHFRRSSVQDINVQPKCNMIKEWIWKKWHILVDPFEGIEMKYFQYGGWFYKWKVKIKLVLKQS